MLLVPAGSVVVVQYAFFVVPLPVKMLAEQPGIELPLLVKLTVPFGGVPLNAVTLAENVTLAPTFDGFCELPTEVYVVWARAFAQSSSASAGSTRAAARRERAFVVAGPAVGGAKRAIDDARMCNLASCWPGGWSS